MKDGIIEDSDIIEDGDTMRLEYPWARRGMTFGEFEEERRYFCQHYTAADLKNGTYIPLWKQRELAAQNHKDE